MIYWVHYFCGFAKSSFQILKLLGETFASAKTTKVLSFMVYSMVTHVCDHQKCA